MAEMGGFSRWRINRRTERRAQRVMSELEPRLRIGSDQRVLELGVGGGGLLALLYEKYHPAGIVGTDFDSREVEAAGKYLSGRLGSLPPSIELRQADALRLPFPDRSFDFVFAMMMLHHVEARHREYKNRPRALAEIRRVLRPGGSLVYSEMTGRAEVRQTLFELGFAQQFYRSTRRNDLAIYGAPS